MGSAPQNINWQICTLIYQENESYGSERAAGTAFLVAKREQSGELSLFVNSAWRDFVSPKHREYIADLFEDFRVRRRSEPEILSRQLCSLNSGPLITHEVRLSNGESHYSIPPHFVELA